MPETTAYPVEARIDAIIDALAAARVELESNPAAIGAIATESGLHPTALRPQLVGWIDSIERAHLERLVASASRPLDRGRVLTLAPGNIPIVAAECLILGVLAGVRHQLALSTRATSLAQLIEAAIRDRLPMLGDALELFVWRDLDPSRRQERLFDTERIVAFGSAETVEWIGAHAGPHSVIVPHGPSLSVAWIDIDRLPFLSRSVALGSLARDLAAFDQRGCRSPHILFVSGNVATSDPIVRELAEDVLPAVARDWPRGRSTPEEIVDQFMDGLTSAVLGTIVEGDGWRITIESNPMIARPSPLGRTLRVCAVADVDDISRLIASLPAPVGCFAVPAQQRPPVSLPADRQPLHQRYSRARRASSLFHGLFCHVPAQSRADRRSGD